MINSAETKLYFFNYFLKRKQEENKKLSGLMFVVLSLTNKKLSFKIAYNILDL